MYILNNMYHVLSICLCLEKKSPLVWSVNDQNLQEVPLRVTGNISADPSHTSIYYLNEKTKYW